MPAGPPRNLAPIDLDNDGLPDLVAGPEDDDGGFVRVFVNEGDRRFSVVEEIVTPLEVDRLDLVDADSDGMLDIVIDTPRRGELFTYLNDGSGSFPTRVVAVGVAGGTRRVVRDLDADGMGDSVQIHHSRPLLSILRSREVPASGIDSNANVILDACEDALRVPGDCTSDGTLDISDAICVLGSLFLGRPTVLPCRTDAEANRALLDFQPDGLLDLSDAVASLRFLFSSGPPHSLADPGAPRSTCRPFRGCAGDTGCR